MYARVCVCLCMYVRIFGACSLLEAFQCDSFTVYFSLGVHI